MPSEFELQVVAGARLEKKVSALLRKVKYRRRMVFRTFTDNGTCYVQAVLNSVRNVDDPKAPRSDVFGRWWVVGDKFNRDIILRTLFAAATELEAHERGERFRYKGKAPFNPHRKLT